MVDGCPDIHLVDTVHVMRTRIAYPGRLYVRFFLVSPLYLGFLPDDDISPTRDAPVRCVRGSSRGSSC